MEVRFFSTIPLDSIIQQYMMYMCFCPRVIDIWECTIYALRFKMLQLPIETDNGSYPITQIIMFNASLLSNKIVGNLTYKCDFWRQSLINLTFKFYLYGKLLSSRLNKLKYLLPIPARPCLNIFATPFYFYFYFYIICVGRMS